MTTKLFSFREKIPNRWIIIRNGATKLGSFPNLISASLLGAIRSLFTYHDCSLDLKRCNARLLLTGNRLVVGYKINHCSQALCHPYNFQDYFHEISDFHITRNAFCFPHKILHKLLFSNTLENR